MKVMPLKNLVRPRPRFQISVSVRLVARSLWDYAEDDHVQRALSMSPRDHHKVENICAWYEQDEYPLPVQRQRITHNHVSALAAITLFEGRLRPLKQDRRKPAKNCPEYLMGE